MHPSLASIRDQELMVSNGPYNVHDHLKGLHLEQLQEISRMDRLPWHTLCLNVTGDLNVGTMIRTSHCMGASSVFILGRQKIDNRSLVGSGNYINVEKIPALENHEIVANRFVALMKDRNLTPIFVEIGGIPLNKVNWELRFAEMTRRGTEPCLVMGNETGGIPGSIVDTQALFPNSFVLSIPQRGVIRSLNVAVAHAMVVGSMCVGMEWI